MSKWPHACPDASHPACHPDLTGHEAVSPVSIGYGLSGQPLPRIQHCECCSYFLVPCDHVIPLTGWWSSRWMIPAVILMILCFWGGFFGFHIFILSLYLFLKSTYSQDTSLVKAFITASQLQWAAAFHFKAAKSNLLRPHLGKFMHFFFYEILSFIVVHETSH